jgi:hypothetical protein
MTTTPGDATDNLPGKPPVVDLATWQAARQTLLARETSSVSCATATACSSRTRRPAGATNASTGPWGCST